jgi:hypothetical protein
LQQLLSGSNTLETSNNAKLKWNRISCVGLLVNNKVKVITDEVLGIDLPILLILSFSLPSVVMVSVNIKPPSTAIVYWNDQPFGKVVAN